MKRRRLILAVVVLVVILLGVFVVYGIPLVQAMFTPPITGLPTTSAGNSLQARYTQTAQARISAPGGSATPQTTP
jgi:hypothetical protein